MKKIIRTLFNKFLIQQGTLFRMIKNKNYKLIKNNNL